MFDEDLFEDLLSQTLSLSLSLQRQSKLAFFDGLPFGKKFAGHNF